MNGHAIRARSAPDAHRLDCRLFLGVMLLGCLVLLGLTFVVRWTPDPFAKPDPARLDLLSTLPSWDVLEIKELHAAQSPRVDVGVFGNSRSVSVGREHMTLPEGATVYNFGIGGIPFQASVLQLERLASLGKAPRVALIQFDHPAVNHPPYAPLLPDLFQSAIAGARELAAAAQDGAGALAHHAVGWAEGLGRQLTAMVNGSLLRTRLSYLFAQFVAPRVAAPAFRADGSREQVLPRQKRVYKLPARENPPVPALDYYMLKLSQLEAGGVRIVVYESPLHPAIAANGSLAESSTTQERRAAFARACRRHNVTCRDAPVLSSTELDAKWEDESHPPAVLLGSYLSQLATGALAKEATGQ